MIELDGIQYTVQTPEENVSDITNAINNFCEQNGIKNSKDEVIHIEMNWANPLYVMLYGVAYLASRLQSLLYSAGCALSVASASAKQLLNISDIAHVPRRQATKTVIVGTVYSNLSTANEPVDCRVTKELSLTANTTNGTVIFHPAFDITIPIGSSRTIILIAETYGAYSINANNNASFDENPEGFRLMELSASTPGQDQESIQQLRLRLQRRIEMGTMLDKAMDAITGLDGVSLCNIYFNPSVTTAEVVADISVPPRQALVIVQGWSDYIAQTFYNNILCQCAGADSPRALLQTYTTPAGQELVVPIIPPENLPCYIRIYINQVVDDITKQAMRDTIATLAQNRTIGQVLTSVDILQLLTSTYPQYAISGARLSWDDITYDYQIQPGVYQLVVFDNSKIQIISTE